VTGSSARNTACGSTCPVTEVSYTDAQLFITMLNNQTGKTYRLPTEAEWEYAARSGGQDLQYGNSASVTLSNYAWYTSNSSNQIHPAGQKQPNELGLYDMAGNVTEWVKDLYDADYYGSSSSPKQNPQGPGSGLGYVTRGGYYSSGPTSLRTSDRSYSQDTYSAPMLGFRVVRTIN
jgi:formylglycine-generating enzyme required for sulfatase activity